MLTGTIANFFMGFNKNKGAKQNNNIDTSDLTDAKLQEAATYIEFIKSKR